MLCQARAEGFFFFPCSHKIPKLNGANIFFVGDTLAVTAVEPESGTAGTRTWRSRLSLSRSSWEAGVHQSVSAPVRRVPFPPGSDRNWCSSSADPVVKSIDKSSQ